MSALLGSLFADWWPQIVGALATVAAAAGLYLKGRSDAGTKAKVEDITNANDIRKSGADARDRVAADVAAGKLRETDGFKRD